MFTIPSSLRKHFYFLFVLSIGLSFYTATFSHMNNWLIFKASFKHLMDGLSLYVHYPQEHNDLYKYSPSFALLMAPLSFLPATLGAILWNLSGALLFTFALIKLPLKDGDKKATFWISLPEFIGSTQGFQSNIHMVALLLLFWIYLEKEQAFLAALCILSSFFIKIFGIIGLCIFVFSKYSTKNIKFFLRFSLSFIFLGLFLTFLPLVFTSYDLLNFQYAEWARMLSSDITQTYGFSAMGVFHSLTGLHFNHLIFQVIGGTILMLLFLLSRNSAQPQRLLALVSISYFLILFNHRSESPTFIIAMIAFGIHQSFMKTPKVRWSFIIFTLGCVSLMYSDIFRSIKQSHLDVYCVKVWPFLILWPYSLFQIFQCRKKTLIS